VLQPEWGQESHRRIKNVIVVMEWVPDAAALTPAPPPPPPPTEVQQLNQYQQLNEAFGLLLPIGRSDEEAKAVVAAGAKAGGQVLTKKGFKEALRAADVDVNNLDSADGKRVTQQLLHALGPTGQQQLPAVDLPRFSQLLRERPFYGMQQGRHFVALSLLEVRSRTLPSPHQITHMFVTGRVPPCPPPCCRG
jgi:hypothetical protein